MKVRIPLQKLHEDEAGVVPGPWMPWSTKYVTPTDKAPEIVGVILGIVITMLATVALIVAVHHREPKDAGHSPSLHRRN